MCRQDGHCAELDELQHGEIDRRAREPALGDAVETRQAYELEQAEDAATLCDTELGSQLKADQDEINGDGGEGVQEEPRAQVVVRNRTGRVDPTAALLGRLAEWDAEVDDNVEDEEDVDDATADEERPVCLVGRTKETSTGVTVAIQTSVSSTILSHIRTNLPSGLSVRRSMDASCLRMSAVQPDLCRRARSSRAEEASTHARRSGGRRRGAGDVARLHSALSTLGDLAESADRRVPLQAWSFARAACFVVSATCNPIAVVRQKTLPADPWSLTSLDFVVKSTCDKSAVAVMRGEQVGRVNRAVVLRASPGLRVCAS